MIMIICDDLLIENPLVSVIVLSYNQSTTITQTIESILEQKISFDYEIIIGDDCSSDTTRQFCIEYQKRKPERFKLLFNEENQGVASNFVNSVKRATGKYIAVCAADDFWHNDLKLQMQVDFFENNAEYGLIYTDYDKLNIKTGRVIHNYLRSSGKRIYQGSGLIQSFFSGKVPALATTVMFRKGLFDKYIPVDDYLTMRFPIEDWPTWLILSKYTKIGYLPVSTCTYRFGHESISNPLRYEILAKKLAEEHIMYKYLCEMFPDDLNYNESDYLIYLNELLLNLAYNKIDYMSAKQYSNQIKGLGSNQLKGKIAQHWMTFMIFAILKKVRHIIER